MVYESAIVAIDTINYWKKWDVIDARCADSESESEDEDGVDDEAGGGGVTVGGEKVINEVKVGGGDKALQEALSNKYK